MTCTYCGLIGHRARSCPVIRLERAAAALADAATSFAGELLELRLTILELTGVLGLGHATPLELEAPRA